MRTASLAIGKLCARQGLQLEQAAVIGDDLNDLPALEYVRFRWGVRELCELLIEARSELACPGYAGSTP